MSMLRLGSQILGLMGVALAATWAASPATAADFGGSCCADMEERIAELEATTARKGNRKISLTVSGWVNQAIFFWDDGTERNVYVGTNELEQDRFRFTGDAKITSGWSAGYVLEIGTNGAGSKGFSQDNDGTTGITVRKSAWYVKSKDFGRVTIGKYDPATYHLIDNLDTLLTRNVSDYEAAGIAIGAFQIRKNGAPVGTTKWSDVMGGFNNGTPGQIGLGNVARFDSPEFAGFATSAAWGEDDQWDIALKYKGDIGDFKINAGIGYGESTDSTANTGSCTASGKGDCQWWGVGAIVSHTPTGLFVYGGYGGNRIDPLVSGGDDTSTSWYLQSGIERKWNALGRTNIFTEYRHDDVGLTNKALASGSNLDFWAAGVAQNIESADMTLYALYRHYDGDFTSLAGVKNNLDDFDMVITGAKINF